jgi:arylamine N-acetyltransferase
MSGACQSTKAISAIEALMMEKFRTEPFHNLRLMYGEEVAARVPGGTCSDKTLSFLRAARLAGFQVALHSASIGGEEKHRLARVHVDGRVYFADVGDGWPALQLYPADRVVAFRAFGIGFRTEVQRERLLVYCERQGREDLQLAIDVRPRPERDILGQIERRFTSGVSYPFSSSLRFACVVGDRFLFLRGERLEIYREGALELVNGVRRDDVPDVLREYFRYELRLAPCNLEESVDGR